MPRFRQTALPVLATPVSANAVNNVTGKVKEQMKPISDSLRLTALILALGSPILAWQELPESPPTQLIMPDKGYAPTDTSYSQLEVSMVGSNVLDRTVLLRWSRRFDDGYLSTNIQKEATAFWPTDAAAAGENRICVAGKTIKGKTIIQLWFLSDVEQLPVQTYDSQLQEWVYPETTIPVTGKITLYKGSSGDKKLVRFMFPNLANEDSVFVLFNSSRDLYELDVVGGGMHKVLTATNDGTAEYQPELAVDYTQRTYARHISLGYVYWMSAPTSSPPISLLFLQDADMDGILDPGSSRTLDVDDWEAMQLGDAGSYQ